MTIVLNFNSRIVSVTLVRKKGKEERMKNEKNIEIRERRKALYEIKKE